MVKQGFTIQWRETLPIAAAIAFATAVAIVLALWLERPEFPLDDAYIIQHTATQPVFATRDSRFPLASPMTGVTSPVYALAVTLLAMVVSPPWAQFLVGALAVMLLAAGVSRYALAARATPLAAIALAVCSVITGMSFYHLFNGLETGLAMALVPWALYWFRNPVSAKRWHFVVLGVMPYVRPELGLLTALLFVRWYIPMRREQNPVQALIAAAGWGLLGAVPFAALLLMQDGSLLPSTMAAKKYFFAEGCQPPFFKWQFAWRATELFLSIVGIASIGFLLAAFSTFRSTVSIVIVAFLCAYVSSLPGALFHNDNRYLYVLLPLAWIGWAESLGSRRDLLRIIGGIGLALVVLQSMLAFPDAWHRYRDDVGFSRLQRASVSSWVAANLPQNAVVMIHDAGYISLIGSQPLVDLVGLKTKSSIPIHEQFTWKTCGRNTRAVSEIAKMNHAEYLVVLDEWDRLFGLTKSLLADGWVVGRVDGMRGDMAYKVYRLDRKET